MSQRQRRDYIGKPPDDRRRPDEYGNTAADCIAWIEDHVGVVLTAQQRDVVRAVYENQRTIVVAANGIGKTFVMACLTLAWLFTHYPASILATSGTYQKLKRTYCRPIERLHKQSIGLPGRYLHNPPRIVIDDEPEQFWEATSPADPGELEGVHSEHTLGIVEEADKDDVDAEVIDSMESLLTNDNDRLVVVANPPRDEANVVYDLMTDDAWHLVQKSSFDSHNVQIELGNRTGDPIDELVTLEQIRQDWRGYNGLDWPGVDEAMDSDAREDLDVRWYRRRLGIIPPAASDTPRPFTAEDVRGAYRSDPEYESMTPGGIAWDVARGSAGGDFNAVAAWFGRDLRVLDWWRHTGSEHPHLDNEETMKELIDPSWHADMAIDAVGVGSESYDRVSQWYAETFRWDSGANAADQMTYANRWTEALCTLGHLLRDGAAFYDERLREELLCAARVVEKSEKYSAKHDTTRYTCTPKDAIKQRLGRSPDLLDAACMAAVMLDDGGNDTLTVPGTW